MIRPAQLNPKPGIVLTLTGGLVGSLLLSALLFLAPSLGIPFIDIPHLVGGLFTESPTGAFWLGFWLFFAGGTLVLGPALTIAWPLLPDWGNGLVAAVVKGLAWGAALWILSGLLLPLMGVLNQLAPSVVRNPGFFAISTGILGALGLLGGHLAFGLSVALVAQMGRGISPLDVMGWPSYHKAETPPGLVLKDSHGLPEYPYVSMR